MTADVQVIDRRLEERSRRQVERGLVAETEDALRAGVPATAPVLTGIGYAEALAYIRGEITLDLLPVVMASPTARVTAHGTSHVSCFLTGARRRGRTRVVSDDPTAVGTTREATKEN